MKTLLPLIILLLSTSWNQVIAKTDTGEGRNGPDKGGVSIPVTLDKFINVAHFEVAQRYCMREQYRVLYEQILRRKLNFYYSGLLPNLWGSVAVYSGKLLPKNEKEWIIFFSAKDEKVNFSSEINLNFYRLGGGHLQMYERVKNQKEITVELNDEDYLLFNSFSDNLEESRPLKKGQASFYGGIEVEKSYVILNKDILGYSEDIFIKSFEIINRPLRRNGREVSLVMDIDNFKDCLFDNIAKPMGDILKTLDEKNEGKVGGSWR